MTDKKAQNKKEPININNINNINNDLVILVEKKIERFMISGNSNVQDNFATNEKIKIE